MPVESNITQCLMCMAAAVCMLILAMYNGHSDMHVCRYIYMHIQYMIGSVLFVDDSMLIGTMYDGQCICIISL